ncbi:MAG: hypothetical protein LC737_03690, partial [Chloroflexi bacterium]|nr:hypothetical protein [Chloroflexota bacterium]
YWRMSDVELQDEAARDASIGYDRMPTICLVSMLDFFKQVERHIRRLPVEEGDEIIGVVRDTDIFQAVEERGWEVALALAPQPEAELIAETNAQAAATKPKRRRTTDGGRKSATRAKTKDKGRKTTARKPTMTKRTTKQTSRARKRRTASSK